MANSTSYSAAVATKEENSVDDESPSSSSRPGDVFVFAKAQALVPQEPSQEYGSEGLTWEDDYYNDKEDIVAVFDVDGKTVSDFHHSIAIKCLPFVVLCLFCCLLFVFFGVEWVGFLLYFFPFALGAVVISIRCIRARRAKSAKIHMAVTSDCIRYDQESPDAHVMVS
jgi:hypothetical protein